MLQSFKLAIKSILSNKLRSFLTMLGIIIGVAAVIILVSIVSAYIGDVIETFESMGANNISITTRGFSTRRVTDEDMYKYWDEHSDWINALSPIVSLNNVRVKKGSEDLTQTSIIGVSEDYSKINKKEIKNGRNISYSDVSGRTSVCVLGSFVAEEFFGDNDKSLSEIIKINGRPFTVIGVVEVIDETSFKEGGADDFIWIPYTVATKMNRNGFINSYMLSTKDTKYTENVTETLETLLYDIFKNDWFFTVSANASMIKQLQENVATLTIMLSGIAGISLLVAGIGVMNIMLVSVTERTREIGIRKALGARQGVIMQQFVIEAAVTSMIGGVIGIFFGAIVTKSIGSIMKINANPTFGSVMLSFCVSVAIGLIFGYLPAKSAARLNPIDALRVD